MQDQSNTTKEKKKFFMQEDRAIPRLFFFFFSFFLVEKQTSKQYVDGYIFLSRDNKIFFGGSETSLGWEMY